MRKRFILLLGLGFVLLCYLVYSGVQPLYEAAASESRWKEEQKREKFLESLQVELDEKVETEIRRDVLSIVHAITVEDIPYLENQLIPEIDYVNYVAESLEPPGRRTDHELYQQVLGRRGIYKAYKRKMLRELSHAARWIQSGGGLSSVELTLRRPRLQERIPISQLDVAEHVLREAKDPEDIPGYYKRWREIQYLIAIDTEENETLRLEMTLYRNNHAWVLGDL